MDSYKYPILLIGIITLILIGIAVLAWINYSFLSQDYSGQEFISLWVSTRQFLIGGISPYEKINSHSAQIPNTNIDTDEVYFIYPFYTVFLISPFAIIGDYLVARAAWMTALEVAVIVMVFINLGLSQWRIPIWLIILLIVFSLLWYYDFLPVVTGNPSVLVALFIAGAFLSIRQELDALAGVLLAISTIKPQMVILLVPLVILWAISQKRFTIIWSLLGSTILLIISGLLFVPDWILQNIRQVISYPSGTLPGTPGEIFYAWLPGVGKQMGWLLTLIFTFILIWEWKAAWKKRFRWFLWTACLTLVITNVIGIRTTTANYIAMYPALIFIFALWDQRWGRSGRIFVVISMLILFFGLWWLFLTTLINTDQPIQHPILFFPLPIYLLIGLYWVRWQAIRTPGPILEEYRIVNDVGDI